MELLEGTGDAVGRGDLTRLEGGPPAPTAAKITVIRGHKGSRPVLVYAAAYGDPSVLVVFADKRPAPRPSALATDGRGPRLCAVP